MITKEKALKNKYTLRYITEKLKNSQKQISDSSRLKEYIDMTFFKEEDYENYPLNINFSFENDMLFLDSSFDRKVYSYNFVELKSIRTKIDSYRDGKVSFKNLEEYLFDNYYKKVINLYKKSLNVDSNINNYYKSNISFSDLNINAQKDFMKYFETGSSNASKELFAKFDLLETENVIDFLSELAKLNLLDFSAVFEEIYKKSDNMAIVPEIISHLSKYNMRYYFFSVIRYLNNKIIIKEKDKNAFLNALDDDMTSPSLFANMFLQKSFAGNETFLDMYKTYLLKHNKKYYDADKLMVLNSISFYSLMRNLPELMLPSDINANHMLISNKLLSGFKLAYSHESKNIKKIFTAISKYVQNIYISKRTLYFLKENYEFETHEPFPIKDENVTFIDQAPEEVKLIETCNLDITSEKFMNDYFDKYNLLPVEIEF